MTATIIQFPTPAAPPPFMLRYDDGPVIQAMTPQGMPARVGDWVCLTGWRRPVLGWVCSIGRVLGDERRLQSYGVMCSDGICRVANPDHMEMLGAGHAQ